MRVISLSFSVITSRHFFAKTRPDTSDRTEKSGGVTPAFEESQMDLNDTIPRGQALHFAADSRVVF